MSNQFCPLCVEEHNINRKGMKVIYFGLPVLMCPAETCNCMWGFWSNLATHLPYNGWMMTYQGSYLSALWTWLTGGWTDQDEDEL